MATDKKKEFLDYIDEFAWHWGRLWNTELTPDEKMEKISQSISTPSEFYDKFTNETNTNQNK